MSRLDELKNEYPFLYETHLHTKEASRCAVSSGKEMADATHEFGYTGIFVTDHNWGGNTCVDTSLPWKEWVKLFFAGYYEAKAEGDKIGLDVFPAWEAGYKGTEFLIYGITPEYLAEHEEFKDADVMKQFELVHRGGGIVIHAHPFREEWYIPEVRLYPEFVDGAEIINATHSSHLSMAHNNPQFDESAIHYANEHNFPTTAGSDVHSVNLFGGGMAFKSRITSVQDFISRIINGEDYVLTNGDHWYTKKGELIV